MGALRFLLPLVLFVALIAFLAVGLQRDPRLVPSPLIGKPVPAFALGTVATPATMLKREDLLGQPFLLNVWASWCVECRAEHAVLLDLARSGKVALVGLNYHDELAAARDWLHDRGDPYRMTLFDPKGQLGLDLGVYGVPETFLIDAGGTIRYKHVGALSDEVLNTQVLPLLTKLAQGDR